MDVSVYDVKTEAAALSHGYLMPALDPLLQAYAPSKRVFELGCGNGSAEAHLSAKVYQVTVIHPSESGCAVATKRGLDLHQGSTGQGLALAVAGKMDGHSMALREGGHIKFFSRETLGTLFCRTDMQVIDFKRVGRIPQLAKSMIGVYRKVG